MRQSLFRTLLLAATASMAAVAAPCASAAAQRTFVASFGADTNPCSLASPCRGFDAAIAQTLSGGEVIVMDSAGYGIANVTKSVSIIAPAGVYAGISVFAATSGIVVNAADINVVLQNLVINGLGGDYGVLLQQGAEVLVTNCTIANFKLGGIFVSSAGSKLFVKDSVVRGTTTGPGILLSAVTNASVERVRLLRNSGGGLQADSGATATVKESVITESTASGILVSAAAGITTQVSVEDSLLCDNLGNGIAAQAVGAASLAAVSAVRNTITRNNNGASAFATAPAAVLITATNNLISQHAGDGLLASGSGATIIANDNTFARSASHALNSTAGGIMRTVTGADGLPNNSGVEVSPTGGAVTPIDPF